VALSVALLGAWFTVQADAADTDGVRTLAREKAAAVGLMQGDAARAVVRLAQGRLFTAYLEATTQGEGARLTARINQAFVSMAGHFGLREFELIDRSGAVVARVVMHEAVAGTKFDMGQEPMLAAGFAQKARSVKSSPMRRPGASGWTISHVAPVGWHGQTEFVLRVQQDGTAYRRILALGADAKRYVVLADQDGRILSDSRPGTQGDDKPALTIAGQSLQSLRRSLKGTAEEGSGKVGPRNKQFNVSYRAVGRWTVVAVEPIAAPRNCPKGGERLCG